MAEEKKIDYKKEFEKLIKYTQELENSSRLNEIIAQLNFLFKVVEFKDAFPKKYVQKCVDEIQKALVLSEDKSENPKVEE